MTQGTQFMNFYGTSVQKNCSCPKDGLNTAPKCVRETCKKLSILGISSCKWVIKGDNARSLWLLSKSDLVSSELIFFKVAIWIDLEI